MSAFVKIDLHGMRQEEAIRVIDKAIAAADSCTGAWRRHTHSL
jgi:DNA-nicking Smr family endonuclease